MVNEIKSLSVSAIKTFTRCPQQYYYAYIEKIKRPINVAMIAGSSVHYGLEKNFKHKEKEKEDLKTKDVLEIFSNRYENTFNDPNENIEIKEQKEKPDIKDKSVRVLEKYHKEYCPEIMPRQEFVERWFELEFDNVEYHLKGKIDIVTDKDAILDYKISARTQKKEDYDLDPQLPVYGLGFKALTGKYPKKLQYHFLKRTKEPDIQTDIKFAGMKDYQYKRVLMLMAKIAAAVKAGIFFPVFSPIVCSWCGYKEICQKGK
jgi:RecB family exonuclease